MAEVLARHKTTLCDNHREGGGLRPCSICPTGYGLLLGVIEERGSQRVLGDAGRPVVSAIADVAAETRGLVAVGVIGEGRRDRPATRAHHRMRHGRSGRGIAIGADIVVLCGRRSNNLVRLTLHTADNDSLGAQQ